MAKKRSVKVYGQSGYKYRETPTIMLKGLWLKEAGFDIGDYISVTCEDGKIIITQDAERAAVKAAEAEFMEREMKALQKRYEAEKEILGRRSVMEERGKESAISMCWSIRSVSCASNVGLSWRLRKCIISYR